MNEKTPNPPVVPKEAMKMPTGQPVSADAPVTNGPVLVTLAVLLLVLLGGLYYWFTVIEATPTPISEPTATRPTDEANNEPESTTAEAQTDALEVVSTSDELSAIEADIEATNLEVLDSELNAIDAELEAAASAGE